MSDKHGLLRQRHKLFHFTDREDRGREVDDQPSFERIRPRQPQYEVTEDTQVLDLAIVSPVNHRAPEAKQWERYLGDLQNRNQRLGSFVSSEYMACEFVSAETLTAMLADKYTSAFADPNRIKEVQKRFRKTFNLFMREHWQQINNADFEQFTGSVLQVPDTDVENMGWVNLAKHPEVDFVTDEFGEVPYKAQLDFSQLYTGRLDIYDGVWGIDLGTNEQLLETYRDIKGHLKQEGLNTWFMDHPKRLYRPHVPVFEPHDPAAELVPTRVDMPYEISLYPPAAR